VLGMKNLVMIHNMLSHAWSENTAETYGSGLLLYHIFCDQEKLSEECIPMSPVVITAFMAPLAGCYIFWKNTGKLFLWLTCLAYIAWGEVECE